MRVNYQNGRKSTLGPKWVTIFTDIFEYINIMLANMNCKKERDKLSLTWSREGKDVTSV